MIINIKVELLDWTIYNYGLEDIIGRYDSFKDVLNDYKYDYDEIVSHWKRKGFVSVSESHSFILLDRDEI